MASPITCFTVVCATAFLLAVCNGSPVNESRIGIMTDCPYKYYWKQNDQINSLDRPAQTGHDSRGNPLYSCRFPVNGVMSVGKASTNWMSCWVTSNGREVGTQTFEMLLIRAGGPLWRPAEQGKPLPNGAVAAIPNNYIGNCIYGNEVVPGRILGNPGVMFIPYGGGAHICNVFNALVCQ